MKRHHVLSYTAGLLDGEGSISIIKQINRSTVAGYSFHLRVVIYNTNEWLIKWLQMQFGGIIVISRRKIPFRAPLYSWRLSGNKAANFLVTLCPYLLIKRPQAEVALAFQAKKNNRRGTYTNPMTSAELTEQEKDRLTCMALNVKPGRKYGI